MKKTDYSEICRQKLEYLNYSSKTIKIYISYINQFLQNNNKAPTTLNSQDFQSYLDNYIFTSLPQQNQIINTIRFLYKEILNKVKLPI